MSVWLGIPSKRPPEEAEKCLKEWRERGYSIAVVRDSGDPPMGSDWILDYKPWPGPYRGYAETVNALVRFLIGYDPDAEFFVCAGDDTLPDPNHTAEEIARQCVKYFGSLNLSNPDLNVEKPLSSLLTLGVMQPTGDRWHEGAGGFTNAPIDRVAGSPWIGREFARRMYGGSGPYWHEYRHCFVDEELQCVAEKLGLFWQRRDLTHKHNNWARGATDKEVVNVDRMPAFLEEANSLEHWRKYKAIFTERKAAGFPGSEPIA